MQNIFHHINLRPKPLFVGVMLSLAAAFSNFISSPVTAKTCDDVQFIFARGSGEHLGDVSYQAWESSIKSAIAGLDIQTSFYELGSRSVSGYQYPAVSVSDDFWGYVNLINAYFTGGEALEFGESVAYGVGELRNYLSQVAFTCPQTKFVLGGYSQGAMVLSKSLEQLDSNKILYVATFGDPKIYLPEGDPGIFSLFSTPDACRGINLSLYRAYVPDCRAYMGVLGSIQPYQPANYAGKIGTWCNDSDIMCSSGASVDDHTSYTSKNLYRDAATYIYKKLVTAFPEKLRPNENKRSLHDLVFLFDSTGSMEYMLDRYKEEALKLAERIIASGGRVALYEYKDLSSDIPVRQLCDFGCTESDLEQQIASISAGGGGDDNESLLHAAATAMHELNWSYGATKTLFVLTDGGYHSPDRDGTTEAQVIAQSLSIDPVNFYVLTKTYNTSAYAKLTAQTGGKVLDVYNSGVELSTELIYERPVAKLSLPAYSGEIEDTFTFDASSSYSLSDADLRFDWDFNGDGIYEVKNGPAVVQYQYDQTFSGYVVVKVSDANTSSTMSAAVTVSAQSGDLQPSRIEQLTTEVSQNNLKVDFTTDAEQVLVFGNGAPLGFVGVENSTGNFTMADITGDIELTLVPYHQHHRGSSQTINISVQEDTLQTEIMQGAPNDFREESTDNDDNTVNQPTLPGESTSSGVDRQPNYRAPSFTVSEVADNVPDFIIPTAPDTGTKS